MKLWWVLSLSIYLQGWFPHCLQILRHFQYFRRAQWTVLLFDSQLFHIANIYICCGQYIFLIIIVMINVPENVHLIFGLSPLLKQLSRNTFITLWRLLLLFHPTPIINVPSLILLSEIWATSSTVSSLCPWQRLFWHLRFPPKTHLLNLLIILQKGHCFKFWVSCNKSLLICLKLIILMLNLIIGII